MKNRKAREKEGLFIAEGERFVFAIPEDWNVEFYALSESYVQEHGTIEFPKEATTVILSDAIFQKIAETNHPQGILAVCQQKEYIIEETLSKHQNGFYLLAEELNDPGNLGTIIRTADACGVHGIFLSKGSVDLYNPKVLRSTMGSIFHVPVIQNVDLEEVVEQMQAKKIIVLAAHLKGQRFLYDFDFSNPCAILIGNEARGISDNKARLCDDFVKIPMEGQAESLNASIAAGVLMYEAVRQRIQK